MRLEQYGINPDSNKIHEESVYTLALLYNVINHRITNYLKPYGLNPSKLNFLLALRHHGAKEGLRQVELSRHLILSPSNMTKIIDQMSKSGLVSRVSATEDRRANLIKTTAKADKLIDSCWDGFQSLLHDLSKDFGDRKQKQFMQLSSEWLKKLS